MTAIYGLIYPCSPPLSAGRSSGARPQGRNPDEVFEKFTNHLGRLLNRTITDAPLSYLVVDEKENRAYVSFRRYKGQVAAPLFSRDLYLFLGQVLTVVPEGGGWRLKTLSYRYWIQSDDDPNTDSWFFRFEYTSPTLKPMHNPRHHLHLPCTMRFGAQDMESTGTHPDGMGDRGRGDQVLGLRDRVRCKARTTWDRLLLESEAKFREWTTRTVP